MKNIYVGAVLLLITVFLVFATAPLPFHPAVPPISAMRSIELASKFVGAETNAARYCSAVMLVEGSMTPAPTGSPRHWRLVFQDAGIERTNVYQVYVDMTGQVTDTIPTNQ